ncbi:MAG: SIS domain-containing protein [Candidatus Eremiobacteraeota bacterium]|nr:SIS domain-containing protein [Candidatus Eremiobacteraeota bacterium]
MERHIFQTIIVQHQEMIENLSVNLRDEILELVEKLETCIRNDGKVLIFGNGGSAADAQHMAAELMGRFRLERDSLPVYALTTNTSILTAIGNDYDFSQIFKRQLEGITKPGDVIIGISTSGNAKNVIEGLNAAKKMGAMTYLLTGESGGAAAEIADVSIKVPSSDTARIQEGHILIIHTICHLLEERLFGDKS